MPSAISVLRSLTPKQRSAVLSSYLGWTLDAFDFFILVFVIKDVAAEFAVSVTDVTYAILLTLAARPLGALLFGLAADKIRAAACLNDRHSDLFRARIRIRLCP